MKDRKIIFESRVGSHLYGTNRPESDEDFQGVFLPSKKDLLGIENCSTEWNLSTKISSTVQNTIGDVDRKFYSLKRFLHLAAEGQPGQLELLFSPQDMVISQDPIWLEIKENLHLFLCRKSIAPFIGFALAQAHKATIKGENLNLIRRIIQWYDTEIIKWAQNKTVLEMSTQVNGVTIYQGGTGKLKLAHDIELKYVTNKEGFTTVELCGRNYDIGLKLKTFVNNIKELEGKFGKRSQAAAENKYDYKSLMHAYRLLEEGKELLKTGKISLPRPKEEVEFLRTVRDGTCGDIDHWTLLTKQIDTLRQEIEPNSPLPEEADHARINELCMKILHRELKSE